MNLWLFSSGDGDDNVEADRDLVDSISKSRPKFTFIPSSYDSAEYYYDQFIDRFGQYGYKSFSLVHLDKETDRSSLRKALQSDLIYLSGGNTFYFLLHMKKTGFDTLLRRYVQKNGILAGNSAGSIIMTPHIKTASYPESDRDENNVGLEDYTSLGLVDFEVFPHYWDSQEYQDQLISESRLCDHPIYGLPDHSALHVTDSKISFYGNPSVFIKGQRFRIR